MNTRETIIFITTILMFSWLFWVWIFLFKRNQAVMEKQSSLFQKGDKVEAFGNIGEIRSVGPEGHLIVKFEDFESTMVFNNDGKLMKWHKHVSLKKV